MTQTDINALSNLIRDYGIRSVMASVASIASDNASDAREALDKRKSVAWNRISNAVYQCISKLPADLDYR